MDDEAIAALNACKYLFLAEIEERDNGARRKGPGTRQAATRLEPLFIDGSSAGAAGNIPASGAGNSGGVWPSLGRVKSKSGPKAFRACEKDLSLVSKTDSENMRRPSPRRFEGDGALSAAGALVDVTAERGSRTPSGKGRQPLSPFQRWSGPERDERSDLNLGFKFGIAELLPRELKIEYFRGAWLQPGHPAKIRSES